jgi:hypothetical protein
MRIKSLWSITIRAAQDWWEDNCLRLAASLAPLALLLVGRQGWCSDGKRWPVNWPLSSKASGARPAGSS